LRRPYLFRISVRSETGYCRLQPGKARSWWITEFPETVRVLPTARPNIGEVREYVTLVPGA
jgi:hypothetical protein